MTRLSVLVCVIVVAAGCGAGPVASKSAQSGLTATRTSASNVWIVWDAAAHREPLEAEFDCLANHTNFNDLVATYRNSPYRANQILWDPAHGHGGSTTVADGACGALYAPNPQCLINAVLDDPSIGVPQDGDLFIYVVPGECGGGNNNGGSNGLPQTGAAVIGAGGAAIHVMAATVGDGSGSGYYLCQERVAVHETFEAVTDVSAADCCTGQTPGNLCDQCSPTCAVNWSNSAGPAGYGSNSISCNGQTFVAQKVEPWLGQSDEWLPQYCQGAVAKNVAPPPCGCYAGDGTYCGSSADTWASQHGCSLPYTFVATSLYSCYGGTWSLHEACANGCTYNPYGGDYCTPPPSCNGVVCGGNCCPAGDWCGASDKCCSGCGTGCAC